MRLALVALLVAALASGCFARSVPFDDASAARAGVACGAGEVVTAFNATGAPSCSAPAFAGQACAAGEVVTGFAANGSIVCSSFYDVAMAAHPYSTLQQRAENSTTKQATQVVASNLKVVGIYGSRGDQANISDIKIMVELPAGAVPNDIEKVVIRYSDGMDAPTYYEFEDYDGAHPEPGSPSNHTVFQAQWLRGEGDGTAGHSVMKAGDLVELHFTLSRPLAPREAVQIQLIPESGSVVPADFKTPATYASDRVITLR